jgi:hypothetical protein
MGVNEVLSEITFTCLLQKNILKVQEHLGNVCSHQSMPFAVLSYLEKANEKYHLGTVCHIQC